MVYRAGGPESRFPGPKIASKAWFKGIFRAYSLAGHKHIVVRPEDMKKLQKDGRLQRRIEKIIGE
jgi:hypothetical protein